MWGGRPEVLVDEARIRWLVHPENLPSTYVREALVHSPGRTGRPCWPSGLMAFAELRAAEPVGPGILFRRRIWWLGPDDPYPGGPAEAVDPFSVSPGKPSRPATRFECRREFPGPLESVDLVLLGADELVEAAVSAVEAVRAGETTRWAVARACRTIRAVVRLLYPLFDDGPAASATLPERARVLQVYRTLQLAHRIQVEVIERLEVGQVDEATRVLGGLIRGAPL